MMKRTPKWHVPVYTLVGVFVLSAFALGASPAIKGSYPYFDLTAYNGIATGSLPGCAAGVAAGEGWFAFDSTTKTMKVCNGTAWGAIGADFSNVASDIIPGTDLTFNLGNSTKTWSGLYTSQLFDSAGQVRLNIAESQPSTNYGNSSDGVGALAVRIANITTITASDTRYSAAFFRDAVTNRVANVDTNGNFRRSATAFAVPTVHGTNDTTAKDIESGSSTFTTGTKAITFTTAFGVAPNCICTTISATVPCSISSTASTTAVTFAGTGSDAFQYICMGTR